MITSLFRPGKAQFVSQDPQQALSRVAVDRDRLAIQNEPDGHRLGVLACHLRDGRSSRAGLGVFQDRSDACIGTRGQG